MRIAALAALVYLAAMPAAALTQERLRVIIETDIGGDADDQASFVRFLLYANEWDIEGIIADRSAATFDKDPVRDHLGLPAKNGHELALAYLKAYGKVYPHLSHHAKGYPTAAELVKRTVPGHNESEEGVRLVTAAADRDDPRPIWYGNWGSNSGARSNLRRALDRARATRTPADFARFATRFRIVTLDGGGPTRQGHDDHIVLHVETGYPTLDGARWYHRFRPLTEKAGGFNVVRDVKQGGGALGALYTTPKEDDSWSFIYLIPTGLSDPLQPEWGGWAGRYGRRDGDPLNRTGPNGKAFYWANQIDLWNGKTSRDNTARRWAVHLQNDFRARLHWCVAERFDSANHAPQPHCLGNATREVLQRKAPIGRPFSLDASGSSDPDGDKLSYRWYVYPEPGSYRGAAAVRDGNTSKATLPVPADAAGKSIHVVLEVTDSGTPSLTRYRRVIVTGE